jgi:hypothetical protein
MSSRGSSDGQRARQEEHQSQERELVERASSGASRAINIKWGVDFRRAKARHRHSHKKYLGAPTMGKQRN